MIQPESQPNVFDKPRQVDERIQRKRAKRQALGAAAMPAPAAVPYLLKSDARRFRSSVA